MLTYYFFCAVFFLSSLFVEFNSAHALQPAQDSSAFGLALPDIGKTIPRQAGKTSVRESAVYYRIERDYLFFLETIVSYAFSDFFGVQIGFPVVVAFKRGPHHSAGASDARVELSFNIYNQPNFLANIMVGVQFPSGNARVIPNTGTGSFDFVGRFTTVHSSEHWYMGYKTSAFVTNTRRHFKNGNFYFFEMGFGPKFHFNKKSPLHCYCIAQLFGILFEQDKFNNITLQNTGGQVFFFGPLLSATWKGFLVEGSFLVPIGQSRYGNQPKFDFRTALTFEVTF